MVDDPLYHSLVFMRMAAVPVGNDDALWKRLLMNWGLVDEPHTVDCLLSNLTCEKCSFLLGPTTWAELGGLLNDLFVVPGLVRPAEPSAAGGEKVSLLPKNS